MNKTTSKVYYLFTLLLAISCLENSHIGFSNEDQCVTFPSSYFLKLRTTSFDTNTNELNTINNASRMICSHTDITSNISFDIQCNSQNPQLSVNLQYESFQRYVEELTNPGHVLYSSLSSQEVNISNTFQSINNTNMIEIEEVNNEELNNSEDILIQLSSSIEEYSTEETRYEIVYNDWDNIGRPITGIVQVYDALSNDLLCGGNPGQSFSTRYRFFSYSDTEQRSEVYLIESGGTPSRNNQCPEEIKRYYIFEKEENEHNKILRFSETERFATLQNISIVYQVNTIVNQCY